MELQKYSSMQKVFNNIWVSVIFLERGYKENFVRLVRMIKKMFDVLL